MEYVWMRPPRREPAIKVAAEEIDGYLERGYRVLPLRDQPEEDSGTSE